MVTVSVPGKVILMGEHAVVYGKPALIAAVNRRLRVTVGDSRNTEIVSDDGEEYIRHILTTISRHFNLQDIPPLAITISSDIPVGYHLGSSAAVAAGVVAATTFHLKKIWNLQLFNQLAYEAEKFIHHNASGVDPATVVSGGLIWYRKELEFLRSIWQFPFGVPKALNHFCLIDTGRPVESTGEMVEYVGSKIKDQKSKMENFMNKNEVQTRRIAAALKEGNETELLDAIKAGERTLEGMGVVSNKVIPLIRHIEKIGGAAKILGGGGRSGAVGFLLCYHREPKTVQALCRPYGYNLQPIMLGEEGVRLEKR